MKDASPTDGTREEFLTARQLAAILQVSESTVRRLAREGRIPSLRITPRIMRFNLKAVCQSLADERRQRPARRHTNEERADSASAQLSFTDLL